MTHPLEAVPFTVQGDWYALAFVVVFGAAYAVLILAELTRRPR